MSTVTYQGLEVLYTRQQIAERVAEMGAQITHDLNGEKLVMIGVLKGAAPFLADLARIDPGRCDVRLCGRDQLRQGPAELGGSETDQGPG